MHPWAPSQISVFGVCAGGAEEYLKLGRICESSPVLFLWLGSHTSTWSTQEQATIAVIHVLYDTSCLHVVSTCHSPASVPKCAQEVTGGLFQAVQSEQDPQPT